MEDFTNHHGRLGQHSQLLDVPWFDSIKRSDGCVDSRLGDCQFSLAFVLHSLGCHEGFVGESLLSLDDAALWLHYVLRLVTDLGHQLLGLTRHLFELRLLFA